MATSPPPFAYALHLGGMRRAELGAAEVSYSGHFAMYWPRLAGASGAILIGIQAANLLLQEVASWLTGRPYHRGINRASGELGRVSGLNAGASWPGPGLGRGW